MSSQPPAQPAMSPPPVPASPPSSSVRRHHTISSASRASRASRAPITEESAEGQDWNNEDEVVTTDAWNAGGGVGAVGERAGAGGLHRQSSLPSRYNRVKRSGNLTPRTINSLSVIAAEHLDHEGDDDWEHEIHKWNDEGDESLDTIPAASQDAASSSYQPAADENASSTPDSTGVGVRRHQSLTYGSNAKKYGQTGLKRSGTMLATAPGRNSRPAPDPQDEEEEFVEEEAQEEPQYPQLNQQAQVPSPARSSPWNTPANEWRTNPMSQVPQTPYGRANQMDDVQRALASLDISPPPSQPSPVPFQNNQSFQPPRFNQSLHQNNNVPGMRTLRPSEYNRQATLDSESEGGLNPYMASPPRGGKFAQSQFPGHQQRSSTGSTESDDPYNTSAGRWDQRANTRTPIQNIPYGMPGFSSPTMGVMSSMMPIPPNYMSPMLVPSQPPRLGSQDPNMQTQDPNQAQTPQQYLTPPIDMPSLIANKGYNPVNFDLRPSFARYFVIKSYTEDDVHKSLKYEIWSSTDPGNKRLDKAFKECAGRGPIYLFFSVNASGHFCGMAEMLTPVDYTRSSTVWASDKWKGVFKVRWIFVRDVPNANLRHIKLNNTQERKPVTNSRDTQELLPDAGMEMLKIFFTHPARTSLLQDFAFYELQAIQKSTQSSNSDPPSPTSPGQGIKTPSQSPPPTFVQPQVGMNMLGYTPQYAMGPMNQMMGMNLAGFTHPQAIVRSVMRDPSPSPGPTLPYLT